MQWHGLLSFRCRLGIGVFVLVGCLTRLSLFLAHTLRMMVYD